MNRTFEHEILKEIKERWSPRAFSEEKINKEDLIAVIEAAHYAPSCFNEQPWRFIIAYEEEDLKIMRSVLTEKNQLWANKAPVLILILSCKYFSANKKGNSWNKFDAGTAWGFLSLEAQRRGLITHAMGGFDAEKARKDLKIPDEYDIIAAVAFGKMGNINSLGESFRKNEQPGIRKSVEEIIFNVDSFK
ncbi:MAG: nitroreductase family protein [Bacteroidales bacterium]|nr:nitroreductase family protein [Bacteroidales bacterium]